MAITWFIGIRKFTKSGEGIDRGCVNTTMLFIVSLIMVPLIDLSPLHLLWMFPVSIGMGSLSILCFPFNLLSLAGQVVGNIACFGLDPTIVQRNKKKLHRYAELRQFEGLTIEEAMKRLKEEGY
jgi:hypothetical protein